MNLRFMKAGTSDALFPDVKVFTLDTPAWNTRTNAFYTRLGYSEVKRDSDLSL